MYWKSLFGEGGISAGKNQHFFFFFFFDAEQVSLPTTGSPPNVRFRGNGRAVHGRRNKQNKKRGNIFGTIGDTGGYNSVR